MEDRECRDAFYEISQLAKDAKGPSIPSDVQGSTLVDVDDSNISRSKVGFLLRQFWKGFQVIFESWFPDKVGKPTPKQKATQRGSPQKIHLRANLGRPANRETYGTRQNVSRCWFDFLKFFPLLGEIQFFV